MLHFITSVTNMDYSFSSLCKQGCSTLFLQLLPNCFMAQYKQIKATVFTQDINLNLSHYKISFDIACFGGSGRVARECVSLKSIPY